MAICEFYVGYWDKEYLDSQFPERKNTPYFQLMEGEKDCSVAVVKPKNFPSLAFCLLDQLKKPSHITKIYQITFSKDAAVNLGKPERHVLESIVGLHNRLVIHSFNF